MTPLAPAPRLCLILPFMLCRVHAVSVATRHENSRPANSCTEDMTPYSPRACRHSLEAREQAARAACSRGDALGCADLVHFAREVLAFQDDKVEIQRKLIQMKAGGEELPEDLSQWPEETRQKVAQEIAELEDQRDERTALRAAWRQAHRPGCLEADIEPICEAWAQACEGAAETEPCQDLP